MKTNFKIILLVIVIFIIFSSEVSASTESTLQEIRDSLRQGLPLAGSWNSSTFGQAWQVNTLIPDEHIF